jgi:hypothetical protein
MLNVVPTVLPLLAAVSFKAVKFSPAVEAVVSNGRQSQANLNEAVTAHLDHRLFSG